MTTDGSRGPGPECPRKSHAHAQAKAQTKAQATAQTMTPI